MANSEAILASALAAASRPSMPEVRSQPNPLHMPVRIAVFVHAKVITFRRVLLIMDRQEKIGEQRRRDVWHAWDLGELPGGSS